MDEPEDVRRLRTAGFSDEPQKLLSIYQHLPNVTISGTYTHLCSATDDTTRQMEVFQTVLDALHSAHPEPGLA